MVPVAPVLSPKIKSLKKIEEFSAWTSPLP
jgi:hypothetical protein